MKQTLEKHQEYEQQVRDEVKRMKQEIQVIVQEATDKVNDIREKIKAKRQELSNEKERMRLVVQTFKKVQHREKLHDHFSLYLVKSAIYKARYYDREDLTNHVKNGCPEKKCANCLAYCFLTDQYGQWDSVEFKKWADNIVKNENSNYVNYHKFSFRPFEKQDDDMDEVDEITEKYNTFGSGTIG